MLAVRTKAAAVNGCRSLARYGWRFASGAGRCGRRNGKDERIAIRRAAETSGNVAILSYDPVAEAMIINDDSDYYQRTYCSRLRWHCASHSVDS
jgi:hypothetical protein